MSTKIITMREALNLVESSQINPLDIDTSEIRALTSSLPQSNQIDINMAEIVATKALRISDLCSELMAIVSCHVSKLETEKKRLYSQAALVKAVEFGHKTDKARCLFAESDAEYISACNKYSEAQAMLKWIGAKYDGAIRLHYNCKKMLDREYSHERASGFNISTEKVIEQENSLSADKAADDFGSEW